MLASRTRWSVRRGLAAHMVSVLACVCLAFHFAVPVCLADGIEQQNEPSGRTTWMHSDGTYEDGYAWEYGGCEPPDFGSFAERYEGCRQIVAIVLDLSSVLPECLPLDAYVWADDDGAPGEVLEVLLDVIVVGMAQWPRYSRHFIDLPEPLYAEGTWWVGFWGQWPAYEPSYYVGADLNGPGGGSPMTKIAPGQGYPEGWQNVAVRWGPTAALGIGAEVAESPSPVSCEAWGAIKALFQ